MIQPPTPEEQQICVTLSSNLGEHPFLSGLLPPEIAEVVGTMHGPMWLTHLLFVRKIVVLRGMGVI